MERILGKMEASRVAITRSVKSTQVFRREKVFISACFYIPPDNFSQVFFNNKIIRSRQNRLLPQAAIRTNIIAEFATAIYAKFLNIIGFSITVFPSEKTAVMFHFCKKCPFRRVSVISAFIFKEFHNYEYYKRAC